ncbi:MAG: ABC transporter permease [Chloroflexi bacterium]|nr:ABC transporter permease [Chloroflexota bacterium]
MTRYVARRLLQFVPLLFFISLVLFLLLQAIPGGALAGYANNPNVSPEELARLEQQLGVDQPLPVQYARWLGNVLHGDWGYSIYTRRPALQEIADRLPNTVYLMGVSFVVALLVGVPIGLIAALRQYSLFDLVTTTIVFAGQSIPVFWFGLILIIVFHTVLKNPLTQGPLLPGVGMYTLGTPFSLVDRLSHLVLPAAMLALYQTAHITRYVRASMLDVVHQDFVRTARAKGLRPRAVVLAHAFRNAALPLVTVVALELPGLFNGAIFAETIFAWPGMGRLFVTSAAQFDYPVLMAVLMINAALILSFNLVADVAYAVIDPRIRYA